MVGLPAHEQPEPREGDARCTLAAAARALGFRSAESARKLETRALVRFTDLFADACEREGDDALADSIRRGALKDLSPPSRA